MTELREGTMKITVTEAALKLMGEQIYRVREGLALMRPEYLAQCDKCLVFCAGEEVGYRDETRVECKECHQHDWRCDEDLGEDSCPHEHQGVPEWEEVRGRMRTGRAKRAPMSAGLRLWPQRMSWPMARSA